MTTELIVMNHDAIALAADSAATVTEHKIFNTVNKLFSFSKYKPIGVLIYGNAALNSVPWEPLIKTARKNLHRRGYDDISDYANFFFKFLELSHFFPEAAQISQVEDVVGLTFNRLYKEYEREIEQAIKKCDKITISDGKRIFRQKVEKYADEAARSDLITSISPSDEAEIKKKYKDTICNLIQTLFEKLGQTKTVREKLLKIAWAALMRQYKYAPSCSGLVFAGYGEKSIFPGYREYNVRGLYGNKVAFDLRAISDVTHGTGASITPFAQRDMISLFMEGIDTEYQRLIDSSINSLLLDYPKQLIDILCADCQQAEKNEILSKLSDAGKKISTDFKKGMQKYRREYCIDPILDAVTHLPKDELAAMAESLVNLTSLKRKVSMDAETVGGPIDVAVISKGDGFIWIKRKHYFKPALNHTFFQSYFDCREEDVDEEE